MSSRVVLSVGSLLYWLRLSVAQRYECLQRIVSKDEFIERLRRRLVDVKEEHSLSIDSHSHRHRSAVLGILRKVVKPLAQQ